MPDGIRLETPKLRVEVDPETLTIDVLDKSSETLWKMFGPHDADVMIEDGQKRREWKSLAELKPQDCWVTPAKDAVLTNIPAACLSIEVGFAAEDKVYFEISPLNESDDMHARDVLWPRHFVMPTEKDAYTVWCLDQGALVHGDCTSRFHHPEGYSEQAMSWHGGFQKGAGYIAIAETPDDMYLAMWHEGDAAASTFIHWLPSMGRFRYSRRVVYQFGKNMDYRVQAKLYREHMKRKGVLVTLDEKIKQNPNVGKLIGGCVIQATSAMRNFRNFTFQYIPFDESARRIEKFRTDTGIEKAVVHLDGWGRFGYDNIHPDTLPPCPECGGARGLKELSERVKALGYLFGLHDQYIDNYADAPSHMPRYFKVREDGEFDKVNNWAGGMCFHNCYTASLYFVKRNIFEGIKNLYFRHNSPPIVKICAPTAYYLDCFTRTVECYHPDHPLSRTENRRKQLEILRTVRSGNNGQSEPIVLQCEHVRDFCVSDLDFSYGLGHIVADVEVVSGGHQTEAVGVPVPLWHLVFHDAVVLPHAGGEQLNFLHGNPPWFSVGRYGEDWDGVPEKELEVKRRVMALHEDVGRLEMTDHKLLEADGSVQQTVFGGGVSVTVDANNRTVKIEGGRAETKGEVPYDHRHQ